MEDFDFKKLLLIIVDSILTGIALIIFALFHHVLTTKLESENIIVDNKENICVCENNNDKFKKEIISNDYEYSSENISIKINSYNKDFGSGNVTYHVADIYIKDIESFRTVFAKDTYGKGYQQWINEIDKENNAVISINGDFYGLNSKGIVIRNGIVYRSTTNGADIAILYKNGVLKTYAADDFDINDAIANGAWQGWNFGPALLDENGNVPEKYRGTTVTPNNPRTAIGYISSGHYVFVNVEGRIDTSKGLTMTQLSEVMKELGCVSAYNLDGGQSSMMVFNDKYVNNLCEGGREVSDAIIIKEVTNE